MPGTNAVLRDMKINSLVAVLFGLSLPPALAQTAPPLAFSGAEGFGQFTTGGNAGEVVHVTTLADAGPGSFRDAVSRPNRLVVFDVSGIIRLKSNVAVNNHLTLAGQTAPGDGVMLYGRSTSFSGGHDVIVRYLRFREGIAGDKGKCAVNLSGGDHMIFDHCSIEWGRWDCLGLTKDSHDITFQYCLIGEGVDPQRFGSLSDSAVNITYTHNLWINNQSRNPKAKGNIQYVNNVVYNWGVCGLVGGHSGAVHLLDAIGNYFIAGPNSGHAFTGEYKDTDHLYQRDNYVDLGKTGQLNGRLVTSADFGKGPEAPTLEAEPTMGSLAHVTVEPAATALANVVAHAGCSLHRDSVDARLIDAVSSYGLRGKIVESEADAGGIGEIPELHAPAQKP